MHNKFLRLASRRNEEQNHKRLKVSQEFEMGQTKKGKTERKKR
jgi:hypothetical protein